MLKIKIKVGIAANIEIKGDTNQCEEAGNYENDHGQVTHQEWQVAWMLKEGGAGGREAEKGQGPRLTLKNKNQG